MQTSEKIKPVLVLGIGNILLSDEGAGVSAVELIRKRFIIPNDIETVDGGTIGMELLPYLTGRRLIIIADAVRTGHPPGTVIRIDDLPAFFQNRTSPHQIGIADALALSSLSGETPPRTVLFGIEPRTIDFGIGLSREVSESLPYLVERIAGELCSQGFTIQAVP
jgi:hydrogenase maturation protease